MIFAIVAYTGWESVASLGEETENPERNIGRGMWISVLALGIMFSFFAWGVLVGWGTSQSTSFGAATNSPLLTLAHRYWHGADIILLVALWNSGFAGSLAIFNQSTRMWFGMADTGALPKQLRYVHPKYKTPVGTILAEAVVALIAAFILYQVLYDPLTGFGFYAFALSFAIVFIYSLASIATGAYFWRERRAQFNPVLHLLFPIVTTVALVWSEYKSVVPLLRPRLLRAVGFRRVGRGGTPDPVGDAPCWEGGSGFSMPARPPYFVPSRPRSSHIDRSFDGRSTADQEMTRGRCPIAADPVRWSFSGADE